MVGIGAGNGYGFVLSFTGRAAGNGGLCMAKS